MMWLVAALVFLAPHLPESFNISADPGSSSITLKQSETLAEDFPEASVRTDKPLGVRHGREACTIPCDVTAKMLREEKHSLCGHLQQSLVSYGRSTRKLIRDLMEEQQRAMEFLTSQVTELMTKVQTLSSEVQRSNTEIYSAKPVQSHGRDCSDIKDTLGSVVPTIPSGIYIIHPENTDTAFEVFCEMDYMDGGWTVMQRRTDGMTDFGRPWTDYTDGFGHLPGEHWLGLRKVFHVVNQKEVRFQLHIALVSGDDTSSYASYDDFRLDNETHFYSIHLGRYAGSAGDAFRGYDQDQNQDTAPFSTLDVDNDGCSPFCSLSNQTVESCSLQHHRSGWWFNQCGLANLNGSPQDPEWSRKDTEWSGGDMEWNGGDMDRSGGETERSRGNTEQSGGDTAQRVGDTERIGRATERSHIHWDTWTQSGVPHYIKSVTMKIRRIPTKTHN
ncbi:angiopoietin-related protein 5 [Coregonus clupeaformis]|uniref:angiopoietin-related protein 5 n=1 Tax=Coregonus clupeaformis TaxID=59861 RepID=UPI001BE10D74|nr:angiopoietin-related protein 5 [Coregonus clupeaformis]